MNNFITRMVAHALSNDLSNMKVVSDESERITQENSLQGPPITQQSISEEKGHNNSRIKPHSRQVNDKELFIDEVGSKTNEDVFGKEVSKHREVSKPVRETANHSLSEFERDQQHSDKKSSVSHAKSNDTKHSATTTTDSSKAAPSFMTKPSIVDAKANDVESAATTLLNSTKDRSSLQKISSVNKMQENTAGNNSPVNKGAAISEGKPIKKSNVYTAAVRQQERYSSSNNDIKMANAVQQPNIKVNIGRIEIKANQKVDFSKSRLERRASKQATSTPALKLADYLHKREK